MRGRIYLHLGGLALAVVLFAPGVSSVAASSPPAALRGVDEGSKVAFATFLGEFREHLIRKDRDWLTTHVHYPLTLLESVWYYGGTPGTRRIRSVGELLKRLEWLGPDDADESVDPAAVQRHGLREGEPPSGDLEFDCPEGAFRTLYTRGDRVWVEAFRTIDEGMGMIYILEFQRTRTTWILTGARYYLCA